MTCQDTNRTTKSHFWTLVISVLALSVATSPSSYAFLFAVDSSSDTITRYDPDTGSIMGTFATPTNGFPGVGLAGSGNSLFFNTRFQIFELSVTGTVLNNFSVPSGSTIDGLAVGASSFGATLFGMDYSSDEIILLNPANGFEYARFTPPVPNLIGGAAFDPTSGRLYVSDFGFTDTIYALDPNTGVVLNSFSDRGRLIYGMAFEGGRLFVSDNSTDLIYELNPTTGLVVNFFDSGLNSPAALASAVPVPVPEPSRTCLLIMSIYSIVLFRRRDR